MPHRLTTRQRVLYGAAGIGAVCLAAALVAAGFAFSAAWPGLSWAVGSALALVGLVVAGRWLRAAFTGESKRRGSTPERGGTV
jgi:hypothetical protein